MGTVMKSLRKTNRVNRGVGRGLIRGLSGGAVARNGSLLSCVDVVPRGFLYLSLSVQMQFFGRIVTNCSQQGTSGLIV
jgi:hypothetical protein